MACLAMSIMEVTFTSSPWFQASRSVSTAVPFGPPMPTLFTSTSTPPKRATASPTMPRQSSRHVTSAATTRDSPPSSAIISAVRAAQARSRSTSTTRAPASASRMAAARPLPIPSAWEPAPVTIATLPSRSRAMRGGGRVPRS